MRWWKAPFFCVGVLIGVAGGLGVTLLVFAFALVVLAVHALSFLLADVGYRIRRDLTLPLLEQLAELADDMRELARKKSPL